MGEQAIQINNLVFQSSFFLQYKVLCLVRLLFQQNALEQSWQVHFICSADEYVSAFSNRET